MDTMKGLKRTSYCGEVEGIGTTAVVGGYVQKIRDLGNLIFIDLRDRTGIGSYISIFLGVKINCAVCVFLSFSMTIATLRLFLS